MGEERPADDWHSPSTFYLGTVVAVERVQTGVRIERNILKF
jgi:hypothetical protein